MGVRCLLERELSCLAARFGETLAMFFAAFHSRAMNEQIQEIDDLRMRLAAADDAFAALARQRYEAAPRCQESRPLDLPLRSTATFAAAASEASVSAPPPSFLPQTRNSLIRAVAREAEQAAAVCVAGGALQAVVYPEAVVEAEVQGTEPPVPPPTDVLPPDSRDELAPQGSGIEMTALPEPSNPSVAEDEILIQELSCLRQPVQELALVEDPVVQDAGLHSTKRQLERKGSHLGSVVPFKTFQSEDEDVDEDTEEVTNVAGRTSMVNTLTRSVSRRTSRLWSMPSEALLAVPTTYPETIEGIVTSRACEGFFSLIIMLNCATMGMEAQQLVEDTVDPTVAAFLVVTEHVFTALFSLELIGRVHTFGFASFNPVRMENLWNFMDAFLVIVTGVLFTWILPLMSLIFGVGGLDKGFVRILTVLRSARLLRLVRVVQRVNFFKEAWLLLRGLMDSVRTLCWTCVVILFITYIFAVFGIVLISKTLKEITEETSIDFQVREDAQRLLEDYFGGLDLLMQTLIQVLTMDSFHGIMREVQLHISWAWLYFYAYVSVACLVLMNLVTAIIVENAVATATIDADQALKQKEALMLKELAEMQNLFLMMDTDGDGHLCWEEFKVAFDDPELSKRWKLLDFQPEECREVFSLLDNGDGNIDTQEFFDGLRKMKGGAQSRDLFRMHKQIEKVKNDVEILCTASATDTSGVRLQYHKTKGKKLTTDLERDLAETCSNNSDLSRQAKELAPSRRPNSGRRLSRRIR